ncbi:hypothetical protein TWF718_002943 [Orbilia javanica]|uniref:Uncharacterized protein n=1 Tax=Orbilia javanica TaxID=47235 RepID=A0AAN8MF10_9PEZI
MAPFIVENNSLSAGSPQKCPQSPKEGSKCTPASTKGFPTSSRDLVLDIVATVTVTGNQRPNAGAPSPTSLPLTFPGEQQLHRRKVSPFAGVEDNTLPGPLFTRTARNSIQYTPPPGSRSPLALVKTSEPSRHSPPSVTSTTLALAPRARLEPRSPVTVGVVVVPGLIFFIILGIIGWIVYKKKFSK